MPQVARQVDGGHAAHAEFPLHTIAGLEGGVQLRQGIEHGGNGDARG